MTIEQMRRAGASYAAAMQEMTRTQWWDFAMSGTKTGKVAITRKDGQALVTPIWFLLDTVVEDGESFDEIVFTTHSSGAKARILRRDPRLSLVVDDQSPPYSYVQFQGVARLSTDDPDKLAWSTALGGRYMGADRAEEYGRRNAVDDEFLVRARITHVIALADIAE